MSEIAHIIAIFAIKAIGIIVFCLAFSSVIDKIRDAAIRHIERKQQELKE
ncbi:MAG: hypothetical protein KGN32_17140 [Burkholderiales bacterium]|nr:hypothetical protein [Burkholderiales bacterium]